MKQEEKETLFESIRNFKNTKSEADFEKVYSLIIDELTAQVFSTCALKCYSRNNEDVADITQKCMVKLYKSIDSLENEQAFFKWMSIIIKNACFDHFDLSANKYEVDATTLTSNEEEKSDDFESSYLFDQYDANEELKALDRNELADIISTCMKVLDSDTQDIIQMRTFDEMTFKEISSITGLNENSVKSKFQRGKVKLGDAMEAEAKKRGFKLYDVSFFSVFLFLHKRLFANDIDAARALLSTGGHFGTLLQAIGKETVVKTAANTTAKYVPFFATKLGKGIVAGCVAVGVISGTAIGLSNAKKSETKAEEETVEVVEATEEPKETEETVTVVEANYKAEDFTIETNGKEVKTDSNPLNYIVVKDADGNEIELTRESKKKYVYDCDEYTVVASYDNRKLSDDEKQLSATVTLTVDDKTVDLEESKKDHDVSFTVKQEKEAASTSSNSSSGSNSSSKSSTSSNAATTTQTQTQSQPAHTHSWTAVYRTEPVQTGTVHHEATGHYETQTIVDVPESTEQVLVRHSGYVCVKCGEFLGDVNGHYCNGGYWNYYWADPIYETVTTPAQTHEEQVWVEDNAAWDEAVYEDQSVLDHYECSCGATK